MKKLLLLTVVVVLTGCALYHPPVVLSPITPTNTIVIGDIQPMTASDGWKRFGPSPVWHWQWMTWDVPAPQYQEIALEYRSTLIAELRRESFTVLETEGVEPVEPIDGDNNPAPLVLKNLRYFHLNMIFPLVKGVSGFWAEVWQSGKKITEVKWGMHRLGATVPWAEEVIAKAFVRELKKPLSTKTVNVRTQK